MTSLRFIPPAYDSDRRLLRCGTIDVGAVFPPIGTPRDSLPWVWQLWLSGRSWALEGRAKSELAAKNKLMAEFEEFLRNAGLQVAA